MKKIKLVYILFAMLSLLAVSLPSRSLASDVTVVGYSRLQCVGYVQQMLGVWVRTRNGLARTFPINTSNPEVGEAVVMRSGWTGHVGYVVGVSESTITIREANWWRGFITQRTISRWDWSIRGYYHV